MNEVISLALSNDREFVIHTVFQAFGPFDYFVPGLSVCLFFFFPRAYIRNYMSYLYQFLQVLPMAVARSSSAGVAIRCIYFRFYG